MDSIRTFIAVRIPAEVRRRLADIEQKLKSSGADVKWVPEENFHLTLKFLGNVDPDRLRAVCDAIRSIAETSNAFEVTLTGVGAFPKASRPSVVWVGVTTGAEEMKALAARVDDALAGLGFLREERGFSAHVTLGRVRSARHIHRLPEVIESLKDEEAGVFTVGSVAVMKSDLRPSGPVYTVIEEYSFHTSQ